MAKYAENYLVNHIAQIFGIGQTMDVAVGVARDMFIACEEIKGDKAWTDLDIYKQTNQKNDFSDFVRADYDRLCEIWDFGKGAEALTEYVNKKINKEDK